MLLRIFLIRIWQCFNLFCKVEDWLNSTDISTLLLPTGHCSIENISLYRVCLWWNWHWIDERCRDWKGGQALSVMRHLLGAVWSSVTSFGRPIFVGKCRNILTFWTCLSWIKGFRICKHLHIFNPTTDSRYLSFFELLHFPFLDVFLVAVTGDEATQWPDLILYFVKVCIVLSSTFLPKIDLTLRLFLIARSFSQACTRWNKVHFLRNLLSGHRSFNMIRIIIDIDNLI